MKNLILILLLSFALNTNAQERKRNCVTIKVEHLDNYKVKVIKKDTCGEKTVITIRTYLKKEWEAKQRKRKLRKKEINNEKNISTCFINDILFSSTRKEKVI
ncbi:MAG: hypothetical protein ABGW67_04095 [Flavobacteriaceae bacterium]|jgi:hypothetical protein|nr:hypothetical protein [Flavobacteriaceae bacterium]